MNFRKRSFYLLLTAIFSMIIILIFIPNSIPNLFRTVESVIKKDPANPSQHTFSAKVLSYAHPPKKEMTLFSFPEQGIPILMYHAIQYLPGNTLGVPPQQFREEMEWLSQQGYTTITIDQLSTTLATSASMPLKPIMLTFDDGYADNYTEAWPILKQLYQKATFFVTTNSVGTGMMTWDQLRELQNDGNMIESHTVNHFDLSTLSEEQQLREIAGAKKIIEDHLGNTVTALCYPSGRFNETTFKAMKSAGYTLGFTTQPGIAHVPDSPFTLKRVRISGGISLKQFQQLLQ